MFLSLFWSFWRSENSCTHNTYIKMNHKTSSIFWAIKWWNIYFLWEMRAKNVNFRLIWSIFRLLKLPALRAFTNKKMFLRFLYTGTIPVIFTKTVNSESFSFNPKTSKNLFCRRLYTQSESTFIMGFPGFSTLGRKYTELVALGLF